VNSLVTYKNVAITCAFLLITAILLCLHEYLLLVPVGGTLAFFLAAHDRERLPLRVLIVFIITVLALNPSPIRLAEQVVRETDPRMLVQPNSQLIAEISKKANPSKLGLHEFETFIYETLPYTDDYLTWLSADYWPTAEEALSKGFEDCDGRAIVACSILRSLGYESYVVFGLDHAWVEVTLNNSVYRSATAPIWLLWPRPPEIMKFDEKEFKWVGLPTEVKLRLFPPIFYFDNYDLIALTLWLSFCHLMATHEIKTGLKKALQNLAFNAFISYVLMTSASYLPFVVPLVSALIIPLTIRFPPFTVLRSFTHRIGSQVKS